MPDLRNAPPHIRQLLEGLMGGGAPRPPPTEWELKAEALLKPTRDELDSMDKDLEAKTQPIVDEAKAKINAMFIEPKKVMTSLQLAAGKELLELAVAEGRINEKHHKVYLLDIGEIEKCIAKGHDHVVATTSELMNSLISTTSEVIDQACENNPEIKAHFDGTGERYEHIEGGLEEIAVPDGADLLEIAQTFQMTSGASTAAAPKPHSPPSAKAQAPAASATPTCTQPWTTTPGSPTPRRSPMRRA